jgi:hypothetical protein
MSLSTEPPCAQDNLDNPAETLLDGIASDPRDSLDIDLDKPEASSLPVPIGPLRRQLTLPKAEAKKPSLWKRITMRKRPAAAAAPETSSVEARLGAIDAQLGHLAETTQQGLDAVYARLEEVWESEEQLSHLADLQDKLDRLTQNNTGLTQSVESLRRTLGWLAGLIVVAAAAAGFVLSQVL